MDNILYEDNQYNANHFRELYLRLLRDLSEIAINSADEYRRYKEIKDYFNDYERLKEIEFAFANKLRDLYPRIPEMIDDSSGISIIVDKKMPILNRSHVKKIITFSEFTIIRTNEIRVEDVDYDPGYGLDFWLGPDISGCVELALRYLSEVRKGIIIPVPDSIILINPSKFSEAVEEIREKKQREFSRFLEKTEKIGGLEEHLKRFEIEEASKFYPKTDSMEEHLPRYEEEDFFDYDISEDPFSSAEECYESPSKSFILSTKGKVLGKNHRLLKIGILLPSLEHVPISYVRKLREDYKEPFFAFQKSLVKLANGLNEADDEKRFVMMLEEIENEVKKIHDVFESIRRTHKRIGYLLTLISIVFCISIHNPKLLQHFHSLLSGAGALAFMEYFRDIRDTKSEVEKNPFYFPFLISKG